MKRFNNILYVATLSQTSETALARAVSLAEDNQAKLTVIDVLEADQSGLRISADGEDSVALMQFRHERLNALLAPFQHRMEIQTGVFTGTPFLEIIREVQNSGYDLVVKSPQHLEWLDRMILSDDMNLLRQCPCPVWLIKSALPEKCKCILAAVDVGTEYPEKELKTRAALNQQILEMACSLALSEFAELHVVHVWSELVAATGFRGTPQSEIDTRIKQAKQQHGSALQSILEDLSSQLGTEGMEFLKLTTHLIDGQARREIPALAKQLHADLVVMGSVARTGIPGFVMGNTAEMILNQLECSVLVSKPPGFVTQIATPSLSHQ